MRASRGYSRTALTGKKIGDLLPEVVAQIGQKGGQRQEAVFAFWRAYPVLRLLYSRSPPKVKVERSPYKIQGL